MALPRKVIQINAEYAYCLPDLEPPILTEDKEWKEAVHSAGQIDPEYTEQLESFPLIQIDNVEYQSVITDYTLSKLRSSIPSDRTTSDYNIKNVGYSTELVNTLIDRWPDGYTVEEFERLGFFYNEGATDVSTWKVEIQTYRDNIAAASTVGVATT